MRRVVITGMGAVSACGIGVEALWDAAVTGRSGVREVLFARLSRQSVKNSAKITEADYEVIAKGARPRFQDRVSILAQVAAREAVAQAGLGADDFGAACGVVIGSGFGGAETLDQNYVRTVSLVEQRLDPLSIPKIMTSSAASWVAMDYHATGPTFCISTACSSAAQSIGIAADLIRAGTVERCLAGGSEALLIDGVFQAWEALHVMTPTLCRPFSQDRNGMVLGEGAGVLVLESYEAAVARGATILAELMGFASTNDATDLLRPNPEGAASCMRKALENAGLPAASIGYVNAHGTGTTANDIAESTALRAVFGEGGAFPLVSSTKPIHGHALGAAGALELIITLCALKAQIAPPTINFTTPDPKIGFDPVANVAKPFSANAALSNSFAFGGINASLVVSLPDA